MASIKDGQAGNLVGAISSQVQVQTPTRRPLNPINSSSSTATVTSVSTPITPSDSPATSSSARRLALREFYRLNGGPDNGLPSTESSSSQDDEIGESTKPSPLDKPNVNIDKYVEDLAKNSDLTTLLRSENELLADIRILQSRQKALVYNNYSKLIMASSTLSSMRGNISSALPDTEELQASLHSIAQFASNEAPPFTEATNESLNIQQLALWLQEVPDQIKQLGDSGQIEDAKSYGHKAVDILKSWAERPHADASIALLKDKCLKSLDQLSENMSEEQPPQQILNGGDDVHNTNGGT